MNNCMSSLYTGLYIQYICMTRDGGKFENKTIPIVLTHEFTMCFIIYIQLVNCFS